MAISNLLPKVPNLGDMFKLHDHHIESAWNVFTDFGQTAGKLNGYRFVGGVGEANVGKDEKDSGQKTNNMAGRASSTAPAVARSTNVEPRVEGVDDSVDGWATAEKVFLAENEHQVTIAELKNLLAFACHSLVSARVSGSYRRDCDASWFPFPSSQVVCHNDFFSCVWLVAVNMAINPNRRTISSAVTQCAVNCWRLYNTSFRWALSRRKRYVL